MAPRRPRKNTLRQVRAEAYRAVVRRAAERVFAEHGFTGARVEQIAKEAGVSVGTIYRAYPGKKREIYRDIQVQRGTELIGRTQGIGIEAWRRRGDVLDGMLAGLGALAEYLMRHPDFLRIVLREEKAWASGPERQSAAQTVMWNEGMGGTQEAIRHGIAAGLLIDDAPEIMARTLAAMQQAHLGYWLESGRRERPEQVAARLQRQFLRAFCRPEVLATRLVPLEDHAGQPPAESRSHA
jgi:AcrR family transcriptional regulator